MNIHRFSIDGVKKTKRGIVLFNYTPFMNKLDFIVEYL